LVVFLTGALTAREPTSFVSMHRFFTLLHAPSPPTCIAMHFVCITKVGIQIFACAAFLFALCCAGLRVDGLQTNRDEKKGNNLNEKTLNLAIKVEN
jgi:hypothetical protein